MTALLANTPTQAESLLHSLEQTAGDTGLLLNANKTEYACLIILNCDSTKLVYRLTYLGSSVSSTESGINMRLTKAWTAIDGLLIIWQSDRSDNMKRIFFQAVVCVHSTIWMHYMEAG